MKKTKQRNIIYSGISPLESHILKKIADNNLVSFGVEELIRLTNWDRQRVYNILHSLQKKNHIYRIRRNQYVITENINEKIFRIATEVVEPSYISFWTALSYYGYTEQQIKTIQLVTTKQTCSLSLSSFNIEPTTFRIKRFFGYKKINDFVIATPEKAFIDSLYQLNKCGGLDEYSKCFKNAWNMLNKKTFVQGLLLFDNKSMISRIGFIIDCLSLKKTIDIKKLKTNISQTPIKLNPYSSKKATYNKKWNILINHQIKMEEIK
jgi:predicted transcriptional regulator of viral defense system